MRVLLFCPKSPIGREDGFSLFINNLMGVSAGKHQFAVACYSSPHDAGSGALAAPPHVQAYPRFDVSQTVPFRIPRWRYLMPTPYVLAHQRNVHAWASQAIEAVRPDVVVLGSEAMAPLVVALFGRIPLIYMPLDSTARNLFEVGCAAGGFRRFWLWSHALRWLQYERAVCRLAHATVVVSAREIAFLSSPSSRGRIHVISNGVDSRSFRRDAEGGVPRAFDLAMSGNFDYPPNADGLREMSKVVECMARQGHVRPRICICGRGGDQRILARIPGAQHFRDVPDMAAAIQQAEVFVSTVRHGSGIRNNVLQAMACEMPVVTYPINVEAIRGTDGVEFCIAENRETLANNIARLLASPREREEMGKRARQYVLLHHDWRAVGARMEKLLEQVCQSFTHGNGGEHG